MKDTVSQVLEVLSAVIDLLEGHEQRSVMRARLQNQTGRLRVWAKDADMVLRSQARGSATMMTLADTINELLKRGLQSLNAMLDILRGVRLPFEKQVVSAQSRPSVASSTDDSSESDFGPSSQDPDGCDEDRSELFLRHEEVSSAVDSLYRLNTAIGDCEYELSRSSFATGRDQSHQADLYSLRAESDLADVSHAVSHIDATQRPSSSGGKAGASTKSLGADVNARHALIKRFAAAVTARRRRLATMMQHHQSCLGHDKICFGGLMQTSEARYGQKMTSSIDYEHRRSSEAPANMMRTRSLSSSLARQSLGNRDDHMCEICGEILPDPEADDHAWR